MSDRPAGTVTLLFSDIEQSTQMLDVLGVDEYGVALDDHRRFMRAAFAVLARSSGD